MEILERAIKIEGGVGRLAVAIGEKQNTVSMWRQRKRVPKGWLKLLESKYPDTELLDECTSTHQPPDRFVSF